MLPQTHTNNRDEYMSHAHTTCAAIVAVGVSTAQGLKCFGIILVITPASCSYRCLFEPNQAVSLLRPEFANLY